MGRYQVFEKLIGSNLLSPLAFMQAQSRFFHAVENRSCTSGSTLHFSHRSTADSGETKGCVNEDCSLADSISLVRGVAGESQFL